MTNLSIWLKNYRKRRKILRVKPHFWYLEKAGVGYVQNYKAGTRSIRQALAMHIFQNLPENEGRDISYQEVTDDLVEGFDKKYSDVFTFVRNPLSRLYSCYANKVLDAGKSGDKFPFAAFGMTRETSFDEFVRIIADISDEKAERHFKSQTWFISFDGKLITDFIGKIETFNEDWEELRGKYGLPESPHNNRSSVGETDFRTFYSKEIYALAVERYRDDIETLGYENDL